VARRFVYLQAARLAFPGRSAGPAAGGWAPWLCVPAFRRVCLCSGSSAS